MLSVKLDKPITTDHLVMAQANRANTTRNISQVTLTFDGSTKIQRKLDSSSRTTSGETVTFPTRTFSSLDIRVDAVNERPGLALVNRNAVGFSEIKLRDNAPGSQDVRVDETMRLPEDMLSAYGASSLAHPLAIVLSRESTMDQEAMNRQFDLPTARSFTLTGTAKIGDRAGGDAIDAALGIPGAAQGGVTATSNERYNDPIARASSALDGDPSTAWNTPIGEITNARLTVTVPSGRTLDHLDLQVVADDRHSIPTHIQITNEKGETRVVSLPAIAANSGASGIAHVPVQFAPLTGSTFTFTFPKARPVRRSDLVMPIGIAELGIPGVVRAAPQSSLTTTCRQDLVTVDGRPFPVRISGSTADALKGRQLALEPCSASETLTLGPGTHQVRSRTTPHNGSAFDVTRLVLTSGAGGSAVPMTSLTATPPPPTLPLNVVRQDRTSMTLHVNATGSSPFWLVLGESFNKGWTARANGHDLGAPQLLDGYANGWLVKPNANGTPVTVSLEWTPQRRVFDAIVISAITTAVCLAIVAAAALRRRRRRRGAFALEEAPPVIRRRPWLERPRPSRRTVILLVLIAGAFGAVLVQPAVGVLLGAFVFLALRSPKWRTLLAAGPVLVLLAITLYITLRQAVGHYPPRFDWPTFFSIARYPAWFAVLMLAADAVLSKDWRADSGSDGADD